MRKDICQGHWGTVTSLKRSRDTGQQRNTPESMISEALTLPVKAVRVGAYLKYLFMQSCPVGNKKEEQEGHMQWKRYEE